MKGNGLGIAYISTFNFLAKKFLKWSMITALCTEGYMCASDYAAINNNYIKEYDACLEKAVKDEERFFNIKFKQKPELFIGFNKARSALMKNDEKRDDYDKFNVLEKMIFMTVNYISTTSFVVSFNESISYFLNLPTLEGFAIDNGIYFGPFKAKQDERLTMLHEIMHVYIHQKNPEFLSPFSKATPDEIKFVRMAANEGLATYAAITMGKAENDLKAYSLESYLNQLYTSCPHEGYGLKNKLCQYAIGYNFVKKALKLIGDKKAVKIIIQNPPTMPTEILEPDVYVKMLDL